MPFILGLLYLLLGIGIIVELGIRLVKHRKFDYFSFFIIYFFGYYIIPGYVLNMFPNYQGRYGFSFSYGDGTLLAFLMILIAYLSILIGYKYNYTFGGKNTYIKIDTIAYIPNEDKFFSYIIYLFWIIGILSLFVRGSSYGGVSNMIMNSAYIRNGDIATENKGSLILQLSGYSLSCLMYASYFVYIKYLKKQASKIMLAVSIFLAIVYLIVNAGRGAIIIYLFCMIFINYSFSEKRLKVYTWVLMFVILTLGVNYLRPLLISFSVIGDGFHAFINDFITRVNSTSSTEFSFSNLMYRLCYYFEHKYVSLETAIRVIDNGTYSFNFFVDIIVALLALVSSSILPFKKPSPISVYNTAFILGTRNVGAIPPGGVAFGYYALGGIGVFLFSFFMGVIGKKLTIFFDSFHSDYMEGMKFVNMFIWIDFYINGDLRQGVLRWLPYLCLLIVLRIVRRRRKIENV